jgi:hypothetical protein
MQGSFHLLTSFAGGLIRNTSVLLLVLWLGLAAAASALATAESFWYHPGVRSFFAALEADLAGADASPADLNAQPSRSFKDPAKMQKNEAKARRKLVAELRQRKASGSSTKAFRQNGRRI